MKKTNKPNKQIFEKTNQTTIELTKLYNSIQSQLAKHITLTTDEMELAKTCKSQTKLLAVCLAKLAKVAKIDTSNADNLASGEIIAKAKQTNEQKTKEIQKQISNIAIYNNIVLKDKKDALHKVIREQVLNICSYNIDYSTHSGQLKSAKCFYIKQDDYETLQTNLSTLLKVNPQKITFNILKNAIVSGCYNKMLREKKSK